MPEVPVPEFDDAKEIYVFAGMALYAANLVESSLINLAAVLQLDRVHAITREVFLDTFAELDQKTLGSLLVAARKLLPFPADVDATLSVVLKQRNYLAHRFFRENAAEIVHPLGKRHMIELLRTMVHQFQDADRMIIPIYEQLWRKYGVDEDFVVREMKEMHDELEAKYGY
jgi:hypothetical protein